MMQRARFIEFRNHIEGFMERVVNNFPRAKDFVEMEKTQMLEKFPELSSSSKSTSSKTNQYDLVKYALSSSVNNTRRMYYHNLEDQIKRSTPEDCVQSLNLLANAIGNANRDILYYSALQGDILSTLKEACGGSFNVILRNNINISRTHALFLMKFHKLASEYPRLLKCELPQNFFFKNFKIIQSICEKERDVWGHM